MLYQGGIDALAAFFNRIEDESGTPENP